MASKCEKSTEKNGCKQRKTCASRRFCHAQISILHFCCLLVVYFFFAFSTCASGSVGIVFPFKENPSNHRQHRRCCSCSWCCRCYVTVSGCSFVHFVFFLFLSHHPTTSTAQKHHNINEPKGQRHKKYP